MLLEICGDRICRDRCEGLSRRDWGRVSDAIWLKPRLADPIFNDRPMIFVYTEIQRGLVSSFSIKREDNKVSRGFVVSEGWKLLV